MKRNLLWACGLCFIYSIGVKASSPIDWEQPTYDWSDEAFFSSATKSDSNCLALNEHIGGHIVCKIDHKSWDGHFAKEKTKVKIADRDTKTPFDACVTLGLKYLSGFSGMITYDYNCKKCNEELSSKVKSIECRFDEKLNKPHLEFKGGTLSMIFGGNTKETTADWMIPELYKMFPEQKKWAEAHAP